MTRIRRGILIPALAASVFYPHNAISQQADPPFLKYLNHPWVDSVLKTLNTEKKAAQLVWIAGFASGDPQHEAWLYEQVKEKGVGGIIFFSGNAGRQTKLIEHYRRVSSIPLMFATDAETGLGMRLADVDRFPDQLTLGAIRNDSLIYQMGRAVASQCKKAGININLAPVADINNNPENPVINFRSFGEDPGNVAGKTLMYMLGMQDHGIFAVAKHFPGHGDTETDSHLDLPVLKHPGERLDSVELVPFRALIEAGVAGVMPGHLNVLSVDSAQRLPATLSHKVLTGLLREKMNFRGLILSDAMNMGGVTLYSAPDRAAINALRAGVDVLEYVTDPASVIKAITESIERGEMSFAALDEKCRKVLAAKYWAGLNQADTLWPEETERDLSSPEIKALIRDLYASSLTLLDNKDNILPLRNLDRIRIATVAVNRKNQTLFQERIASYAPSDNYFVDPSNASSVKKLEEKLDGYDVVIAGIYGTSKRPAANYGVTPELKRLIDSLSLMRKCIIVWFGNPYALERAKTAENAHALLLSYQENSYTEDLSAQLIFGGIGARGMLPVTIDQKWKAGHGILTPGGIRMQYGLPENAGLSSALLRGKVDSIVAAGIEAGAFPGCEVMIARKGVVVLHNTYGYHTYEQRTQVQKDDLYDLASVTKISSTLAGLMFLEGRGKFSSDLTLGQYLPFFRNSDKGDIAINQILTHQAGLKAWIPFWKETTKKNGNLKRSIYRHEMSERFSLRVADNLFIKPEYRDRILKEIRKSSLSSEKKYVYSDLGFIVMPAIITEVTGKEWTEFLTDSIYQRLGAFDIVFNPWNRYSPSRIVPTEYDSLFRRQQLHGTVHDEGAAMLGGISGHAGLFATANDLMKLMETYRRMGSYGGEQIFSRNVMEKYTRVQYPENNNYRGLGFDKPYLNNNELDPKEAYPAASASPSSFGHSGYTGTFVWMDPKYEVSYIFLSNRVYPTRNNNLISALKIRGSILQAVYDSIVE